MPSKPKTKALNVQLKIEQDAEVPIALIQIGVDEQNNVSILGTNWLQDNDGAASISALLRIAANAIDDMLGHAVAASVPVRPRFNPRPPGGAR